MDVKKPESLTVEPSKVNEGHFPTLQQALESLLKNPNISKDIKSEFIQAGFNQLNLTFVNQE